MGLEEDGTITISQADLRRAVEESFSSGVVADDSDIAEDPQFQATIRGRLQDAGRCFGDVGAELERDPSVSEFSLELIGHYFEQKRQLG